jgi:hypothetical protein
MIEPKMTGSYRFGYKDGDIGDSGNDIKVLWISPFVPHYFFPTSAREYLALYLDYSFIHVESSVKIGLQHAGCP